MLTWRIGSTGILWRVFGQHLSGRCFLPRRPLLSRTLSWSGPSGAAPRRRDAACKSWSADWIRALGGDDPTGRISEIPPAVSGRKKHGAASPSKCEQRSAITAFALVCVREPELVQKAERPIENLVKKKSTPDDPGRAPRRKASRASGLFFGARSPWGIGA
jgi:hypothetical protein